MAAQNKLDHPVLIFYKMFYKMSVRRESTTRSHQMSVSYFPIHMLFEITRLGDIPVKMGDGDNFSSYIVVKPVE